MKKLIVAVIVSAFVAGSVWATANTDYSKWTTDALQKKRMEYYREIQPLGNNKNVAAYRRHSEPLPAEDEIKLIERELDLRLTHGDKKAYYEPQGPNLLYKHKNPNG
jgi:hypothetical protein